MRTPVAVALSAAFSRVSAVRIRPTGSPRKIVKPAMAPSASNWAVDIEVWISFWSL